MDERLKQVMASVFQIAIEELSDDASPDTIESWDSLKHMNMVMALQEEFGVRFTDEEIIEMSGYRVIKAMLLDKNDG